MNSSIKRGGVSFGAALTATVVAAAPAAATFHSVDVVRGNYMMVGRGWASNVGAGIFQHEEWDGIRVGETNLKDPWWPRICDYQGQIAVKHPNGKTLFVEMSSFHQGCSQAAWFDFPQLDGAWAEDTRFGCKWYSNHTGGKWQGLGDLKD